MLTGVTLLYFRAVLPAADRRGMVAMMVPADSSPEEREEDLPVEELARRQGTRSIISVDELAELDAFESDTELDEFLADSYASRQTYIG